MLVRFGAALGVAACLMLAVGLPGCSEASRQVESMKLKRAAEALRVGMSREELVALLGQPAKREDYGSTHFYMYETNHLSFSETGRFTPVAVVQGRVAGWGRDLYDATVEQQKRWGSKVAN